MEDELSEIIRRAKAERKLQHYTQEEREAMCRDAAKIFEEYEADMAKKLLKQRDEEYLRDHGIYP